MHYEQNTLESVSSWKFWSYSFLTQEHSKLEIFAENQGYNILILFDVLPNFPFITSEKQRNY